MSLLSQAANDLVTIMSDVDGGFGRDVWVTSPDGATAKVAGFHSDISQLLDPETGTLVSGRSVTLTLPIRLLEAAGLGGIKGEREPGKEPWTVELVDGEGNQQRFVVAEVRPDRGIGSMVCFLTAYL